MAVLSAPREEAIKRHEHLTETVETVETECGAWRRWPGTSSPGWQRPRGWHHQGIREGLQAWMREGGSICAAGRAREAQVKGPGPRGPGSRSPRPRTRSRAPRSLRGPTDARTPAGASRLCGPGPGPGPGGEGAARSAPGPGSVPLAHPGAQCQADKWKRRSSPEDFQERGRRGNGGRLRTLSVRISHTQTAPSEKC
jgi:hypothetical protein